jgi:hypothetical protein
MVGTVVDGVTTTGTVVGLTGGAVAGIVVAGVSVPGPVVQPEKNAHSMMRKARIRIIPCFIAGALIVRYISEFRSGVPAG